MNLNLFYNVHVQGDDERSVKVQAKSTGVNHISHMHLNILSFSPLSKFHISGLNMHSP